MTRSPHFVLLALLGLAATAGCGSARKGAEYAARASLADPGTAEFRNVTINTEGVVCGEVNGRHKQPGVTGFRRYAFYSHTGHFLIEPLAVTDTALSEAALRCRSPTGGSPAGSICVDLEKLRLARIAHNEFERRHGYDCS